jgi:hypothetical protein
LLITIIYGKKKGCSKLELHVFAEVGQHQLRMVEKGECIRGAYDVEAYTVLNMLFLGDQTVKVVTKSTKCMLTMVWWKMFYVSI